MSAPIAGGWVFWAGTVGFGKPVVERLDAARHLDVQRFSVTPLDVEYAQGTGIGPSELGRRIRDAGYEIVVDPVVGWYGGTPHPNSRFGRFSTDDTLRMSEQLGAVGVNLIGQPTHDASLDQLATAFAAVCDRVADFDAEAHLEFTPITAISDLAGGWDVVRTADRPNGGLLFDTWHFAKSTPDLALLARIPGDRIFSVQISDARATSLPDIRQDTQHRELPGDGILDLAAILSVLRRIGALRWLGAEVISPVLASLPTETAALLADRATRTLVDRVVGELEG